MNRKLLLILGILVLFFVPIWYLVIAPRFSWITTEFEYSAGIKSFDNFYDEEAGEFKGEERTVTRFEYMVERQEGDILTIKNVFAVRTVFGDPVFSVERLYGIDRKTGMHVPGYGDHDREGYLFAPRNLKPDQEFSYWHINYDSPARMVFVGEEDVAGLKVFHFKSEGLTADQTENLGHLPGVGVTRGIKLDIDLHTWIEPVTGYLLKYEDNTLANYYDLSTGKTMHPWNKFHNEYNEASIVRHAVAARSQKQMVLMLIYGGAVILGVVGVGLLATGLRSRSIPNNIRS